MELRQLRYFLALAEHGQFGRAAERLHITQQALSMAMSALERDAGCELLIRGRGRRVVELTAAGDALRAHAADVIARADQALTGIRALSGARAGRARFVVGLLGGGAADLNAPILGRFRAAHPEIAIDVRTVGSVTSRHLLGVDVILGPGSGPADPLHTVLFRDDAVVAVPRHHHLAGRSHVHVNELRRDPVPRLAMPSLTTPACGPDGRRGRAPGPTDVDAGLAAVAAGLAITVLAACTARYYERPGVAFVPLTGAPAVPICVGTPEPVDDDPTGPVARFVAVATDTVTRRHRDGVDALRLCRDREPQAQTG